MKLPAGMTKAEFDVLREIARTLVGQRTHRRTVASVIRYGGAAIMALALVLR